MPAIAHPILKRAAFEALDALHNDESVSLHKTLCALEDVAEYLDRLIDMTERDLEAIAAQEEAESK